MPGIVFIAFFISWLASRMPVGVHAQEGDTAILTLRGEGPAETQMIMLNAFHLFETSMGVPVRVFYRNTSSPSAAAELTAEVGKQQPNSISVGAMQFAISEQPLTSAQRANFTLNGVTGSAVHFPLFVNSYGLFYNVPGNVAKSLRITACLMARILKGDISHWTHPDILEKNPSFIKASSTDSYQIVVLVDSASSGATLAMFSWLATACPSVPVSYSTLRSDAQVVGSSLLAKLLSTPYSLGWAMASVGRRAAVPELAVETTIPGQFVVTAASNTTAMYEELASAVPATLTSDYSSVSVSALPAAGVAPILTVAYLITRSNWNQSDAEAQRGEAVRALCRFFHSATMSSSSGVITLYGLLPLGNATINAIATSSDTALVTSSSAVRYDLTDGNGENVLSSTRSSYDVISLQDVFGQLEKLQKTVDIGTARVMRGAGSSAVSLFIWRCFSEMRARSTSPIHLVYRAAGSGSGQSEFVAKDNGYQALVDFGISDTPMPDSLYADLAMSAKIKMVHIPVMLMAITFYVNIPDSALHYRQLKLSPCTLAKIMQGDITTWAHADIAADAGFSLPNQTITLFYRNLSSGTTAMVSAYLAASCPAWRLGSGTLLLGWPAAAVAAASGPRMAANLSATVWSIGYMDTGNGKASTASEVAILNKEGNYVTSTTGDVAAAASSLLHSDSWPKNPTQPFSAVSVLNQPGANTFPIVAMPFMFVRTDLTNRGHAGALLRAFFTFMLDSYAQHTVAPASGYTALPEDVRGYARERALPPLLTDTRAMTWAFESDSVLPEGQGGAGSVVSSFAGTFESIAAISFSDFYKTYTAAQQKQLQAADSAANFSASSGNGTASWVSLPLQVQEELDSLHKEIAVLQALAITGICFGVAGLVLAMFASCRVFVRSTLLFNFSPHGGGTSAVHPSASSSKFGENSVRRQKSLGNISDSSVNGVDI